MNSSVQAHIDLIALQHNYRQIRRLTSSSRIMAMVKSNAYGHGLVQIAKSLTDVDAFGVACLNEALMLRKAGVIKRIVLTRGFSDVTELPLIGKYGLDIVVHHESQIEILQTVKLNKPVSVWLKIDTGMHRLGFSQQEAEYAYDRLSKISQVQQPIYIMTHLASADDLFKSTTREQLDYFKRFSFCSNPKSIANSAAIINWSESCADWVRPGIMLYGVSPLADKTGKEISLRPVMTLQSELIAVKKLAKGDRVGYGGVWECPEDMPVGVVAIGYGDGYPRHAKTGTPVLVNGIRCQIVGRVSMDMLTVDLRNNPGAKCGDEVVLWGKGLPVEYIAKYADTISYELLCGLTQRVQFIYESED
ncbi:MAG: alanine racemase [Coxiella sp. DG_40]|nr:MAG: alanine racemase [Coxiella sp. DG_40]